MEACIRSGVRTHLKIPLGPMTQARTKRFKEAQVEGAHVFNSKEETKMVHVIKVNTDLDQDLRRLTCRFAAIFWSLFAANLVLICY